jgi:hypothetical protein
MGMQRANGDHLMVGTTARDGGVEIVDLQFTRGAANLPLTARFGANVSACNAIIAGSDVDGAASVAGITLSPPRRVADTPLGAQAGANVVAFFGADTLIRMGLNQNLEGFTFLIVSADGTKCETMTAGHVETASALAGLLSVGTWASSGDGEQHTERANGDAVRAQQLAHPQFNAAFAYFTRGRHN